MLSPIVDERTRKAAALGLTHENVSLAQALELGKKIAFLIGDAGVGEGKVALLLAYYLAHFMHELEESRTPERMAAVIPNLVWFVEEGTILLSQLINEREIADDGHDRRQRH